MLYEVITANDGLTQRFSAKLAQLAQWFQHLTTRSTEAPVAELSLPAPQKKGRQEDESDPMQEFIDRILEEEKKKSEEMRSLSESGT